MTKTLVEDCIKLPISELYRKGAIHHKVEGTITTRYSNFTINFWVRFRFTPESVEYSLIYNSNLNERSYTVDITHTYCNYGRVRNWFICPCGKRVGVLYMPAEDYLFFRCRHCFNLTYKSRNLSGRYKAVGKVINIDDLENLKKSVKRIFYRGELTKRYLKYKREFDKFCAYHYTYFAIADRKTKGALSRRAGRPFPFPLSGKLGIIEAGNK